MSDGAFTIGTLVGAVVGFLSASFTKIFGEWLLVKCFGPNLLLSFEVGPHTSGFIVQTTNRTTIEQSTSTPYSVTIDESVCYTRIRVHNSKSRIASNCRAYLVGHKKQNANGRFVTTDYCDSIPLIWSFANAGPINIPKGVNIHCDVFVTLSGSNELKPCFAAMPLAYQTTFSEPGVYLYQIMVTAEGVDPVTIELKVDWKRDWKNFEVTKFTG